MMKKFKKYTLIALTFFSFENFGQAIDTEILSQLTPEQIEMAQELYEDSEILNTADQELSDFEESLVAKPPKNEAVIEGSLLKKYGYDFFSFMPTSTVAVGDLPLPNDYKVSLRDQFTIILSGSKDSIFNLDVKLDGTILLPELGSVLVVGMTLGEVKEKLSELIDQSYIGVNIDVSLQNLSAKKITIVGAVEAPGTYLVNPFSTITGALAYSGGISEIGSLRQIKLIRNSGEIFLFDLYDLLIKGDRSNDLTIEAGDTILITSASQFVSIEGAIKRPAIYEILEDESVNDIVDFALGFNEFANKSNVSVTFLDLENTSITTKTIKNLNQNLNDVLTVKVFRYLNKETSNIEVRGAIEEPGFYDLEKYRNLNDLISDLDFVNTYPWMGILEQFDSNNLIQSTVLFSLNDKSTYQSIELLPNSKLYFANRDDRLFDVGPNAMNLVNDYSLKINHKESSYSLPVFGKYNVKSFVDLLGLDMTDVDDEAIFISPLEDKIIFGDYKKMQFVANKYNNLSFRSPVNDLITISVSGAVEYPGSYTLKSNSTLNNLYDLVGGFKSEAFLNGIILARESIRERQLKSIEQSEATLKKSLLFAADDKDAAEISMLTTLAESIEPSNLGRIAGDFSPNSELSVSTILVDGDELIIPKKTNVISVVGEVLNPISFQYSDRISVQSAITLAGGYQSYADKKRVYVIKANGLVQKTSRNIFQGGSGIQPGDTIVVPRKTPNNSILNTLEPVTQVLSDLAFSAAAIDSLSNN